MTPFEDERNALRKSIARAFESVEYPGDCAILAADCLDDMDVEEFYNGLWQAGWHAAPPALIERRYASLTFFSPDAYRFFIPAYLCYALDTFGDKTSLVLPSLMYNLDPESAPSDLRHRFYVQKQFLMPHERKVVIEFLAFVARHSNDDDFRVRAHRAMKEYWSV